MLGPDGTGVAVGSAAEQQHCQGALMIIDGEVHLQQPQKAELGAHNGVLEPHEFQAELKVISILEARSLSIT